MFGWLKNLLVDNDAEVPSGFVEVTPTQAPRFLSLEYAG